MATLSKFNRVREMLTHPDLTHDMTGQLARHRTACRSPRNGFEVAPLRLLEGLLAHAEAHELRFDQPLADDGVIGHAWLLAARGLRGMLNAEHGRLDAGTVDGAIVEMVKAAGFDVRVDL